MRVMIFTRGRAGSSSLHGALNHHEFLSGIDEPFNFRPGVEDFRVGNAGEIPTKLELLWSKYNLIKHSWSNTGWPFTGPEAQACTRALLHSPDTTYIMLNRRNVLERIVSAHVAEHARIWNIQRPAEREAVHSASIPPLQHREIRNVLAAELPTIASYRATLQARSTEFIELWYEDFFDPALSPDDRLGNFEFLLAKLGLPAARYCRDGVLSFLSAEQRKIGSCELYRRIPGIEEVDSIFGSHSTGHLFDPGRSVLPYGLLAEHHLAIAEVSRQSELERARIIAAMPARNCCDSVAEAVAAAEPLVDAFVFLDDGSSDGTEEKLISRKPYLRLSRRREGDVWDAAAARNALLDITHALRGGETGLRWLLWVDADETLDDDPNRIMRAREFFLSAPPDLAAAEIAVVQLVDDRRTVWANYPQTENTGVCWRPKAFRVDACRSRRLRRCPSDNLLPYEPREREIARLDLSFSNLGNLTFERRVRRFFRERSITPELESPETPDGHLVAFGSGIYRKPLADLDVLRSRVNEVHHRRVRRFLDALNHFAAKLPPEGRTGR